MKALHRQSLCLLGLLLTLTLTLFALPARAESVLAPEEADRLVATQMAEGALPQAAEVEAILSLHIMGVDTLDATRLRETPERAAVLVSDQGAAFTWLLYHSDSQGGWTLDASLNHPTPWEQVLETAAAQGLEKVEPVGLVIGSQLYATYTLQGQVWIQPLNQDEELAQWGTAGHMDSWAKFESEFPALVEAKVGGTPWATYFTLFIVLLVVGGSVFLINYFQRKAAAVKR